MEPPEEHLEHVDPPTESTVSGLAVLESALPSLPLSPGVYRMLDAKGDALYVGKARNLKKRVVAYTQIGRLPERLRRMVSGTRKMEIMTTSSEAEALLLEANLIKRLRPRYNIVLRDDKSYPWLLLTEDHDYPDDRQAPGREAQGRQLFRPLRQRLGGEPDHHGVAARVPAPLLPRHGLRQPGPALPALTRSSAARPLRGADQQGGLRRAGQAGEAVPLRRDAEHPEEAGRRDGAGGRGAGVRARGLASATASAA
jgi:hypothetical protein